MRDISIGNWIIDILIAYALAESISFIVSGGLFIVHRIFIFFKIRSTIKNTIPPWWEIKEIGIVTMQKVSGGVRVYILLQSRLPVPDSHRLLAYGIRDCPDWPKEAFWTNDFLTVNWGGNVIKTDMYENISMYDSLSDDTDKKLFRKQFNIESSLLKLGIK